MWIEKDFVCVREFDNFSETIQRILKIKRDIYMTI
jgi:hypothetical protein